jgi:hypothetical protein
MSLTNSRFRDMDEGVRPTGTQAIERTIAVLCCFERASELSVTEIAVQGQAWS